MFLVIHLRSITFNKNNVDPTGDSLNIWYNTPGTDQTWWKLSVNSNLSQSGASWHGRPLPPSGVTAHRRGVVDSAARESEVPVEDGPTQASRAGRPRRRTRTRIRGHVASARKRGASVHATACSRPPPLRRSAPPPVLLHAGAAPLTARQCRHAHRQCRRGTGWRTKAGPGGRGRGRGRGTPPFPLPPPFISSYLTPHPPVATGAGAALLPAPARRRRRIRAGEQRRGEERNQRGRRHARAPPCETD